MTLVLTENQVKRVRRLLLREQERINADLVEENKIPTAGYERRTAWLRSDEMANAEILKVIEFAE